MTSRAQRPHEEIAAAMVDITAKEATTREAVAAGKVRMSDETLAMVMERRLAKGDALEVARIAGIMGAKKTAELIPLCHPIAIGAVDVSFTPDGDGIAISARVATRDRTGVEMEALTAVASAALTIYDMVKSTEPGVEITDIRLLEKSGGASGEWSRPDGG